MLKTKKTILSAILCFAMVLCLTLGVMLAMPTKVFATTYAYTSYENWQIKHEGSEWQWTENLTKVEEGLYKIEIFWTGSGFNVKSDENPIKKDWYDTTDPDVTIAEEVIAPIIVDVYLRVINDETLKIGIGEAPTIPVHVSDILGKAESDFPTATSLDASPDGAWVNSTNTNATVFVYGNGFIFKDWSNPSVQTGPVITSVVAKDGDNYQDTYVNGKITFNMSDGKLVSISFEHIKDTYASLDGTYAPPHVHTYGSATAQWDGKNATLTVTCTCTHSESTTLAGTYQKLTDASCTAKETGRYVLTVAEEIYAGTYESQIFETGDPLGHHFSGKITYTWVEDECTATWYCDHTGCSQTETETVTGVYVKDTNATHKLNETGHYEATFKNINFTKQITETNSVEKENTKLTGLSGGAIAGISIGSVSLLIIIAYVSMFFYWKKKEKALKFLIPSYKWINKTIFKK